MKITVTSSGGKLGREILLELVKKTDKTQIVGIARTPSKVKDIGIEIRQGDYSNPEDFETALTGIDTIVLVSGNDLPRKRIQLHRNVINAAKKNAVKKIVYTSILGDNQGNGFSHVIDSNRQTEADIVQSGLDWVVGRNGIYIEPDLEAIDQYISAGCISNCGGDGKCGYTSRSELAAAYAEMALSDVHNGQTCNLIGEPIFQNELVNAINQEIGTNLLFKRIPVEKYREERIAAQGDYLGTIISGIYEGIRNGGFSTGSDFERVVGRPHKSINEMIRDFRKAE